MAAVIDDKHTVVPVILLNKITRIEGETLDPDLFEGPVFFFPDSGESGQEGRVTEKSVGQNAELLLWNGRWRRRR